MLTEQEIAGFCDSLPGAIRRYPFSPELLVMSVRETKMFAVIFEGSDPLHLMLKCDPIEAELLRAAFSAIKPGYHMNKRHWNSVYIDGTLDTALVFQMIENSYKLVIGKAK